MVEIKAGQIQVLSATNRLFEDITEKVNKAELEVYGETVESIKLCFKDEETLSDTLQIVQKFNISLKIKITVEGEKEFFYLTPKYCWTNKQMKEEIIERGIAPCQVILLDSKNPTLIINKKVPKRKGQELKLKLAYNKAINVIKKIIGKEEMEKYLAKDIQYRVNEKMKLTAGRCKRYTNNSAIIEISGSILKYSEKVLVNILIHEILHAFYNTDGHTNQWKRYAKLISDHSIYKITRYSNPEAIEQGVKYQICCNDCHSSYDVKILSKEEIKEIKQGKFPCFICGHNNIFCLDFETGTEYGVLPEKK